ncbi:adenylylsulfatase HINT3 isoform X3 [Typha latifolia]|uniref:adenylylsulfatase HINT3 isoform X3 n=1 Tax=Typha latifolia TaxID=4733 RepID=UPI003C3081C1
MASDRRIAVLSSHLRTTTASSSELSDVSISYCAAAGDGVAAAGEEEEEGGGKEKGCVFCMITRGESPAFKLYEDDICLCILDSNPLTYGHSLIIPKCHYPALEATPPPVIAAMCSNVPFLSSAIMKATNCGYFPPLERTCGMVSQAKLVPLVFQYQTVIAFWYSASLNC